MNIWSGLLITIFVSLGALETVKASIARQQALQSDHHYYKPDITESIIYQTRLVELPVFININAGQTFSQDSKERPQGLFSYRFQQDQAILFGWGLQSELIDGHRAYYNDHNNLSVATLDAFRLTENNFDVAYAIKTSGQSYSIGYSFSDYKDKTSHLDNKSGVLNLGYRYGDFSLALKFGLQNEVDFDTAEYLKFDKALAGYATLEMDDMQLLLNMMTSVAHNFVNGEQVINQNYLSYNMGFVTQAKDINDFLFFRLDLNTSQIQNELTRETLRTIQLPMTFGFETTVNSFFEMRGSIKQNFIVYKTPTEEPGANTTTGAVGLSFKLNHRTTIDAMAEGLIGSNADQTFNLDKAFSRVSLVYFPDWYF